ncbi:uncharacterized protein LOC112495198 [Cephus cinctus]|uniref:Uncharacterized protein LOC112495198 n=1 Tax=Cephus cinctus TaxID=211228 RepID=A0AAJ7RT09_CEPCN|nr:uncharacterized protein LOC112495198 [Cephus cinctus]
MSAVVLDVLGVFVLRITVHINTNVTSLKLQYTGRWLASDVEAWRSRSRSAMPSETAATRHDIETSGSRGRSEGKALPLPTMFHDWKLLGEWWGLCAKGVACGADGEDFDESKQPVVGNERAKGIRRIIVERRSAELYGG